MPLLTNALDGACVTYGGEERCLKGFGEEACGAESSWKNTDSDGRIMLKWIFKKEDWGGLV